MQWHCFPQTPDSLDVNAIYNNALVPCVLHESRNLICSLLVDHDADQVKAGIKATGNSSSCNHSQSTKTERSSASIALTSGVALLPRIATLASIGWSTGIRLAAHIWVLLQITKVETKVVDNISLLHYIAALGKISLASLRADLFEFSIEVGMSRGRQSIEDALLSEEEAASADGQEGTLLLGELLLEVRPSLDETERLGLVLDDGIGSSTWDDQDIELLKTSIGILDLHVSAEGSTLLGNCVFLVCREGNFEGFGS